MFNNQRWRLAGELRRLSDFRGRERLTELIVRGAPMPRGVQEGNFGPDLRYRVRYEEDGSFKYLYFLQFEQAALTPVLDACLEPGGLFFDIGANIGIYTSLAARRVALEGRVHAFEPIPTTRRHLDDLLRLNDLDNVEVFDVALGEASGEIEIFVPENGSGRASATMHQEGKPERVRTMTLDQHIEATGCDTPTLIKIDVEGFELPVLRGAMDLLSRADAPPVVFESNPGYTQDFLEISQLFRNNGYELFAMMPTGLERVPEGMDRCASANTLALRVVQHSHVLGELKSFRFKLHQDC